MNRKPIKLVIGVTGGIGSGKTEVCNIFANFGAQVLFADLIAKDLIRDREDIRRKIRKVFGKMVFLEDGKLDRKKMAEIVFNNAVLKKKLDSIIHPPVLRYISQVIKNFKRKTGPRVLMIEAALIYEAGAEDMFDYIIAIDALLSKRVDRIVKRNYVTPIEVKRRMRAQFDTKNKVKRADFIIQNNYGIKNLAENCRFIYNLLANSTFNYNK